jgi:phenylalanyl-tRNA synthetase alpha chain
MAALAFDCRDILNSRPLVISDSVVPSAVPARTLAVPNEYFQRVKDVHERGGYGSLGYGYSWSTDEALKNVLRTHTTAVSSRMLYEVANVRKTSPLCRRMLNATCCYGVHELKSTSTFVLPVQQVGGFKPVKLFSIDRVFRNGA